MGPYKFLVRQDQIENYHFTKPKYMQLLMRPAKGFYLQSSCTLNVITN